MKYTDVILDLETTGRRPGVAIIQIAAILCNVNTGEISDNYFETGIQLSGQTKKGFEVDTGTLTWWMNENPRLFSRLSTSKTTYVEAGREFQNWYRSLPNHKELRIWGNSNRFDIGILEGWYRKALGPNYSFNPFWNTWNERDLRTIFNLAPDLRKKVKFNGTKHNAHDDAKHHLKEVHTILKAKKLKIN